MAMQDHWRNPVLRTPFHRRIAEKMHGSNWYDWAGYEAASYIDHEDMEYFAIRSTAAAFDITPMVKYGIEGRDAEALLNKVTVRDVSKLKPGRVHYTAWCDDEGHVLDDGTLFRISKNRFRLCCQERHLPWLLDSCAGFSVTIAEETADLAGLALQGPTSAVVLLKAGFDVSKMKPFDFAEFPFGKNSVEISRTGFTGDLGYELFVAPALAERLWDTLFAAGNLHGIRAIGYNALNIARIEAGFITANSDFVTSELALRSNRKRRPDEIGLAWMVDMGKGHFNGRKAIARARAEKSDRHVLVGIEIEGNEPAPHAIIYHRKKREVGIVTASIWSPLCKRNIAIASLELPFGAAQIDDLWAEIYAMRELQYHKMMKRVKIVPKPFIKLERRSKTPPGNY
jgi:aminomethyltransferase